jgi:hypothetical protein
MAIERFTLGEKTRDSVVRGRLSSALGLLYTLFTMNQHSFGTVGDRTARGEPLIGKQFQTFRCLCGQLQGSADVTHVL